MGHKRYCFALDLKDDEELILQYKEYHKKGNVWPEIIESIKQNGITVMEIYLTGNRLFMIMEVDDSFDMELKDIKDKANPVVQQWEKLMDQFQQRLPWAKENEKWVIMENIYKL